MPPRAGRYGSGGDFDEAAHPRWPRGAPDDASGDGQGGRFRDRADAVRGWAEDLADSIGARPATGRGAFSRRAGCNGAVMQAARDQVAENERNDNPDPDLRYRLHDTNLIRDTDGLDHMVDQLRAYIAQRYPERDRQLPRDIVDHHDGTSSPDPRHTRLTPPSTEAPQPAAPSQPIYTSEPEFPFGARVRGTEGDIEGTDLATGNPRFTSGEGTVVAHEPGGYHGEVTVVHWDNGVATYHPANLPSRIEIGRTRTTRAAGQTWRTRQRGRDRDARLAAAVGGRRR